MPTTFLGVTVVQPQAFTVLDDSAMEAGNNINDVVIGIVGEADGGAPGVPLEFISARDARKTLVGGDLADAIDRAYAPGVQPGAYRIVAVRLDGDSAIGANRAVRAEKDLLGSAAAAIKVLAAEYGTVGNQIAVEVTAPTTTNKGKNISVYLPGLTIDGVDVGAQGITLEYNGTGVTCTVAVTATGLTTAAATSVPAAIPADSFTILWADAPTLQQVVDRINANTAYVASVSGPNPDAASSTLDPKPAASCLSATPLYCDLQAAVDWFNGRVGEFVTATKLGTATGPLANLAKTYLAGGDDPVITNNSWQEALDILGGVDCQIVCVTSGDATIHAMAEAHCIELSSPENKRERRAILGGVAGETPAQAKARALALNSDHAQLVYPGLKDESGTILAPWQVAMQKAGISAGLRPSYAATRKFLKASGVERTLDEGTVNDLELAGVMVVKNITGKGVVIVHDQTTWLKDQRVNRREFATGLVIDRVQRKLRDVADARIGEPSTPGTRNIIFGDLAAALTAMTAQGLLVGDGTNPPFKNLTIRTVGDKAEISVECRFGAPLNYIGIVTKASIYGGTQ